MRGVNMTDHLVKAVAEVCALSPRPAAAEINGDLALGTGESGDYATLLDLLKPMRQAGVPIPLTLGNHDHRDRFRAADPDRLRGPHPLEQRETYLIEPPQPN